jgi:hypothetical protein
MCDHARETGEFCLRCPRLAAGFKRNRINQPDPIFPQSPGIILKRSTSVLPLAARFVISMNKDIIAEFCILPTF